MVAQPQVVISAADAVNAAGNVPVKLGATEVLTLRFVNAGSTVGYKPYINLLIPRNGADGASGNPQDGVSFLGATYLGAAVESVLLTFDASGNATHPFAKNPDGTAVVLHGTAGDQVAVLTLPFGSFTPGQTPADIKVSVRVPDTAKLATPLTVVATPGFAFGNDPLNNPSADNPITGTAVTAKIEPTLVNLVTKYIGPEQETATGPSYPRQYQVSADIAPGQTITNLVLKDVLPDGAVYLGAATQNGAATIAYDAATRTVTATFTGAETGGADLAHQPTLLINYYVGQTLADGTPVLDPATGTFRLEPDNASLTGTWQPINPLHPATTITLDEPTPEDVFTAKSIAVQKSVSLVDQLVPGGHLLWTLNGQVSNYFDLDHLKFTDVLGDGQHFDAGYTPMITLQGRGVVLYSGAVAANEYTVVRDTVSGQTTLVFDVSKILTDHGKPADLDGGTAASPAPATAVLTFRSVIDTNYISTGNPPSVSTLVDQGDPLANSVDFAGKVVGTGADVHDGSGASVTLPTNTVAKSIYAVNGVASAGAVRVASGDLITYKLTLTTPLTSTQRVTLTDFLPLPVMLAADPNGTGTSSFVFDSTVSGTAPAAGHAQFGAGTTYAGDTPTLRVNTSANSLTFDFGNYTLSPNYASNTIEVLFTVRVQDAAFGDGLLLTNQVTESETNSFGVVTTQNAIVQFTLNEPALKISKGSVYTSDADGSFAGTKGPYAFNHATGGFTGTVSSSGLASKPLQDTLSNVDAGDTVTFAVVVQNLGHSPNGAFDTVIRDTLPAGFGSVTNLRVTDGAGRALAYTAVGGGLFDPAGGIMLTDPTATRGAIGTYDADSGANVVLITYDAVLSATVPDPSYRLTNTATIVTYAALEGGIDRVPSTAAANVTANTSVITAAPSLTKTLTATSQAFTTGSTLAIGETATFDIVVTLPEGKTAAFHLDDLLPSGSGGTLEYVSAQVVSIGGHLTTGHLAAGSTPTSVVGNDVLFDFGDVQNAYDNVVTADDRITIRVTARASNLAANTGGKALTNRAIATEDNPNGGSRVSQQASAAVTLKEPVLALVKSVVGNDAQGGGYATYKLHVTNSAAASSAPAFDVAIRDLLSAQTQPNATLIAGTVQVSGSVAGTVVAGNAAGDTDVAVNLAELDPGQSVDVTFQVMLANHVPDGATITNSATVTGKTLPGGDVYARTETASGSTTLQTKVLTTSKGLVATSDGNTTVISGTPALTIGEVATFQITVTLPRGDSTNLHITDLLPAGLTYVAGSAAVVSVGTALTGLNGQNLYAPAITASGQSLDFAFGGVFDDPAAPAGAGQTITVSLQALVNTSSSNINLAVLTNSAKATTGGVTSNTDTVSARVVLPHLVLQKQAAVDAGALPDAGAMASYTITIGHAADSTSAAYLLKLADLLPGDTALDASSVRASVGTVVQTASGLALTVPQFLLTDAPITLTYRAAYKDTVTPGETLTNTATLDYTSEPTNGRAATQLQASASTAVVLTPHVSKTIVATSDPNTAAGPASADVAVGETITYRITATLGEGTQRLVISDVMPAGLTFLSGQVEAYGANVLGGTAIGSQPTSTGGTVTFDLGTVVNRSDNVSDGKDTVSVLVVARVADGNAAASFLTNTGRVTTSAPGTGAGSASETAVATVKVVAPVLAMTKATAFTAGDAGDVATFTITISHAAGSTSAAYLLNLADLLPSDESIVAGSIQASVGTVTPTATGLTLTVPQFLLTDAPITLTYKAAYKDSVTPGESLTNTATLNYSSAPASGHAATPVVQKATTAVVLSPHAAKSIVSTSDANTTSGQYTAGVTNVAVGETITYRITATLGEGTQHLVISDLLPAGLAFVSGKVEGYGGNILGGTAVGTAPTVNGSTLTFDLGTVVNKGDNAQDAKDQVSVLVTARVLDGSAAGAVLLNTGLVTTSAPGTGAGGAADTAGAQIEVVAPKLDIHKATSFTTGDAGDVATYSVVVSQAALSSAAAYNVHVQDLLAPGMTLVAGSARTSAGVVTEAGGTVSLDLSVLKLTDAPVTLTYSVRLADNVVDGQLLPNTATLGYSSAPVNGHLSAGSDSALIGVAIRNGIAKQFVGADLGLDAMGNVGTGEVLTYRIVATLGEGAQHIDLSDLLPAGLAYQSSRVVSLGGITGAALAVGAVGTYDAATRIVSFGFGDVSNPGNNVVDSNDQIVIEVKAVVSATVDGTTFTDIGTLKASDAANPYGVTPGGHVQVSTAQSTQTLANDAVLGGFAFYDAQCDGVYDISDPVMRGVSVRLLDANGAFTGRSTVTDGTGRYSFTGLMPGFYSVQFITPKGVDVTDRHMGGNPARDSDADANGVTQAVLLHEGETNTTLNVGYEFNAALNYGTQTVVLQPGQGYPGLHNGGTVIIGADGGNNIQAGTGGTIAHLGDGADGYESGFGGVDFATLCGGDDQAQQQGDGGYLFGGLGNDLLQGQYNSAYMAGGPGDDVLVAGGGPSVLIGGTDNGTLSYANGVFGTIRYGDTLYTGNYKNAPTKIVYEKGDGVDYLVDFNPSKGDTLTIYGYSSFTVTARTGSGTVLYLGPNAGFLLQGSYDPTTLAGITFVPDGTPATPQLVLSLDASGAPTLTDNGTVTIKQTAAGAASRKVASDFNGDGKSDLLLQKAGSPAQIWQMNGLAVAATSTPASPGAGWRAVATGDVNADGKSDLVWRNGDGALLLREMDGNTVLASGSLGNPGVAWHVAGTADLDGDGKADLVVQNDTGVIVAYRLDGLAVTAGAVLGIPGAAWHVAATADFDGDGKSDILLQNDDGSIRMWQMNGLSVAADTLVSNPGRNWHVRGAADFNNDGKADIVLQDNQGNVVEWRMSGPVFQAGVLLGNPGGGLIVRTTGDVNGDGNADIVFQGAAGAVKLWETDQNGIIGSADYSPANGYRLLGSDADRPVKAVRDFDDDGRSDILFQDTSGNVVSWQTDGKTVLATAYMGNAGADWHVRATGDVNGDATPDMVVQNDNGALVVWSTTGTSITGSAYLGNPGADWHVRAAGDVNGDGTADIIVQNDNGTVVAYDMDTNLRIIGSGVLGTPGAGWQVMGTGDLDGDGKSDLVLQGNDGTVRLWQMDGNTVLQDVSLSSPGPQWHVRAVGDFNGDGKADIGLQNDGGDIVVWKMDGTQYAGGSYLGNPGADWTIKAAGNVNGDGTADLLLQGSGGATQIWQTDGNSVLSAAIVGAPGATWKVVA